VQIAVIPRETLFLTPGEKRVMRKIKRMYESIPENSERECFLYVQPRLKNLNPDFILVDSFKT